ncbi:uncharacterized protein PV09_05541 [Verruconis gallopava]|uniref:ADP-ribose 1''-phosphate phosphatase n=1 Tax=Verruconis gallopava TaxID=253628 RepID=A0A0D2AVY7_9PEZI|nr:uncharacterized protein PV09_05541 [Verruconis gallopava]KIW03329.1 hypothetical protein PV09_05541 [Verruconis gallopava]
MKRSSHQHGAGRPPKQAKLTFGKNITPQVASVPSEQVKARTSRRNTARLASQNEVRLKPPPKAENGFSITEIAGDIFDAPDGTVLIHACNCLGSWGAGIAAAFKERYPNAYKRYNEHCRSREPDNLVNTALLIPPQESKSKHWVGCLFTSRKYGRNKDSPQQILDATGPSFRDLVEQMSEAGDEVTQIRMCQINSGLFSVPWEHSRAIIQGLELDDNVKIPREIFVYSLPNKTDRSQ